MGDIAQSDIIGGAMMELRAFSSGDVYFVACRAGRIREGSAADIASLPDHYMANIEEVPAEYRAISGGDNLRAVTDYVAGMTDRFAKEAFKDIFIPHSLGANELI